MKITSCYQIILSRFIIIISLLFNETKKKSAHTRSFRVYSSRMELNYSRQETKRKWHISICSESHVSFIHFECVLNLEVDARKKRKRNSFRKKKIVHFIIRKCQSILFLSREKALNAVWGSRQCVPMLFSTFFLHLQ